MPVYNELTMRFSPVGAHVSISGSGTGILTPPTNATKLRIQTLTQNLRYTLDGSAPTPTKGFQLAATYGPITIPISSGTVVWLAEETSGALVQYQWGN